MIKFNVTSNHNLPCVLLSQIFINETFMLCLDVYIQPQNLELALVAPNIGCLDVLEFGIGNEPQYQTTFTPPSPLHFQYRALPLCIGCNRHAHLPRVFSPLSPPRRRRATHPLPFQWVVLPLPASAGWLRHPSPSCGPCHHSTGPGWRTGDRRVHLLDGAEAEERLPAHLLDVVGTEGLIPMGYAPSFLPRDRCSGASSPFPSGWRPLRCCDPPPPRCPLALPQPSSSWRPPAPPHPSSATSLFSNPHRP